MTYSHRITDKIPHWSFSVDGPERCPD